MVAVVVAAIVVVAVLVPAHLSPSVAPSQGVTGTPMLYSQMTGPAATAQASRPGGPWTPEAALGLGLGQGFSGTGGLVDGCTELWENSSTITIPATPSNATAGKLSAWLLASVNGSGDVLLTIVTEVSGPIAASNGVVLQGSCTSAYTKLGAIPSSVVDSSVVATDAESLGGSLFLSTHSGVTTLVGVLGTYWEVEYTTCSLLDPSGTGALFGALFYATNGTLVPGGTETTTESCST